MQRKSGQLGSKGRRGMYYDPKSKRYFNSEMEFEDFHDREHVKHDVSIMFWGAIFAGIVIGGLIIFFSRFPILAAFVIGMTALILYAYSSKEAIYHSREAFRAKQRRQAKRKPAKKKPKKKPAKKKPKKKPKAKKKPAKKKPKKSGGK